MDQHHAHVKAQFSLVLREGNFDRFLQLWQDTPLKDQQWVSSNEDLFRLAYHSSNDDILGFLSEKTHAKNLKFLLRREWKTKWCELVLPRLKDPDVQKDIAQDEKLQSSFADILLRISQDEPKHLDDFAQVINPLWVFIKWRNELGLTTLVHSARNTQIDYIFQVFQGSPDDVLSRVTPKHLENYPLAGWEEMKAQLLAPECAHLFPLWKASCDKQALLDHVDCDQGLSTLARKF